MAKLSLFSLALPAILGVADAWECFNIYNADCYSAEDVITREVAIVGGGSSGTFAAVTLANQGTSFVVIEKLGQLGGHVETYTDPSTGATAEYGVEVFLNTSVVLDFFESVDAPVETFAIPAGPPTIYVDFTTGETLTNFTPGANYSEYIGPWEQYAGDLASGYELPTPVPSDLTSTIGQFITKYGLENLAYSLWALNPVGNLGGFLDLPAVYLFKSLGLSEFEEGEGGGVVVVGGNHLAFANAQAKLGAANILLNSTVVNASRPSNTSSTGVSLIVDTPSGVKLVKVNKLLITAAQTVANLAPFELDRSELAIFGALQQTGWYSGLVSGTKLEVASYQNAATGNGSGYHIPAIDNVMHFNPTAVPGVYLVWYQSNVPVAANIAQNAILKALENITGTSAGVEFVEFVDHSPGALYFAAPQIEQGYWDRLNALQGYRDTWYTGLLFEPASGTLWEFTSALLKEMLA